MENKIKKRYEIEDPRERLSRWKEYILNFLIYFLIFVLGFIIGEVS